MAMLISPVAAPDFVELRSANRKRNTVWFSAFLVVLLVASYVFISQSLVSAASGSGDWPMYRHDATHTGIANSAAPAAFPPQLWNFTLADNPGSSPSPTVVDGLVYVGSADYNIYCFNAATGAKEWSFQTGDSAENTPAVADGRVYAGSGDGYVYCLDDRSGSQIWKTSIQSIPNDRADSPITLADGHVFVGSSRGNIFCLDAPTGDKIWNYSTGSRLNSCPAVSGGLVYVGSEEGGVFCLDASDGAKVWNFTATDAAGSPTVTDGYVYFGSADSNAYCLNAVTGDKIWNYTTEYNSAGPSHNYHWGNTVGDPAVADGRVYVGSSDFLIYCLDADSGNQIWNYTTRAEVFAAPTFAEGLVLAGSYDGNLYCLNASNGSEIWSFPAGVFSPVNAGGAVGSPVVVGGVVYVVGNGVIFALGETSTGPVSFALLIVVAVVVLVVVGLVVAAFVFRRKHSQ
jgi:eukaryotic-like serine/threonine-protein kinase